MPKMKNAELRQAELRNELVEALKRNEEGAVADVLEEWLIICRKTF